MLWFLPPPPGWNLHKASHLCPEERSSGFEVHPFHVPFQFLYCNFPRQPGCDVRRGHLELMSSQVPPRLSHLSSFQVFYDDLLDESAHTFSHKQRGPSGHVMRNQQMWRVCMASPICFLKQEKKSSAFYRARVTFLFLLQGSKNPSTLC